jgi:dipeptidyl aminopeptidase/acylaminoacyl peptidase
MHGDHDFTVPFNQSELLQAALQKAGADSTLITVKGAVHGFGGAENLAPVRDFLRRCLN